jgi:predicted GNAT superfamily acetyltransferase
MHTTGRYGGMALGAFAGGQLAGYSYALPGFDGEPFLLSCGLVVDQRYESRGIGEALKLAQADRARQMGYDTIRWTTNSLASRPLRLYLSKLGARLVRYHESMYAELREDLFPDEVEVVWDLRRSGGPRQSRSPAALVSSDDAGDGLRRVTAVDTGELKAPSRESYLVEIPWDRSELERRDPALAEGWVTAVRTAMQALLAHGYMGTAVLAERSCGRSYVRFDAGS